MWYSERDVYVDGGRCGTVNGMYMLTAGGVVQRTRCYVDGRRCGTVNEMCILTVGGVVQ